MSIKNNRRFENIEDFKHYKNTCLIALLAVLYFYLFIIFLGDFFNPDPSVWTFDEYVEYLQPENDPFLKAKTVKSRCDFTFNYDLKHKYNITPLYDPKLPDPLNYKQFPLSVNDRRKLVNSNQILTYLTRQNRYFDLNLNNKKVLACIPPKSGASNWQTVFVKMSQKSNANSFTDDQLAHAVVGDNKLYKLLPRVNASKIVKENGLNMELPNNKITQFFNFSITSSRNPLTRLVSAYHSKFATIVIHTKDNPNFFIHDYLPVILEKYEDLDRYGSPEPGMRITFQAFVNFVLYDNCRDSNFLIKKCDAHWVPYSYYCQVCNQDYDAITQTEKLEFGARRVFSRIMGESEIGKDALDKKYDSTRQYQHSSIEFLKSTYFDVLEKQVKLDLLKLYYWDFTLYDYDYNTFLRL